jgi:hypothetical protein
LGYPADTISFGLDAFSFHLINGMSDNVIDQGIRFIRALSAHLTAEFNILLGRWQQAWLVSIVPPKRWGKMH